MGPLIMLVLVVWLIESSDKGEWGQPQWAGAGVLVALTVAVCFLAWADRNNRV